MINAVTQLRKTGSPSSAIRKTFFFKLDENDQIKVRYTHGPGIDEPISVETVMVSLLKDGIL